MLTNNIGRALGSDRAEELLGDNDDSLSFSFSFYEYFSIISPKLLQASANVSANASSTSSSHSNGNSSDSKHTYANTTDNNNAGENASLTSPVAAQIDKICWMLCEGNVYKNEKLKDGAARSLNSDDLFKLWKIFNTLAKVAEGEGGEGQTKATLPLRVDVEEAYRIGSLVRQAVGFNPSEVPLVDPTEEDKGEGKYSVCFVDFVLVVCQAVKDLTPDVIRAGIASIYEEILNDVIKKVSCSIVCEL